MNAIEKGYHALRGTKLFFELQLLDSWSPVLRAKVVLMTTSMMAAVSGLVLAMLLLPARAQGQPARSGVAISAQSDSAEQARTAYTHGQAEYNLNNYQDAVKYFEEAYRLKPVPGLLFNIGQCYRALGELQRAAAAYRSYLRNAAEGDRNRGRVKELLTEMQTAIARQETAKAAKPQGLAKDAEGKQDAALAGPRRVPAPPDSNGATAARSSSTAGEAPVGAATVAGGAGAARGNSMNGGHAVNVNSIAGGVSAAPANALAISPAARMADPAPRLWTWVAAGGAVVALGAGTAFGLKSRNAAQELTAREHSTSEIAAQSGEVKTNATKANVLFAAGAVLAVAAGVLFVIHF